MRCPSKHTFAKHVFASVCCNLQTVLQCAGQETRVYTCFLHIRDNQLAQEQENTCLQVFLRRANSSPGNQPGNACRQAFSARRQQHPNPGAREVASRNRLVCMCFCEARFKGAAWIQGNTCLYVFGGGFFCRASQDCKIHLFARVFAKFVWKAPRGFKETLVCTCFAKVCFLGHRKNAKCTCLYVFSQGPF